MLRASEDRAPAVLRRREQRRFSSASADEVGGSMRAMHEQLTKALPASEIARAAQKRKVPA
jgi:hypothetical protein